MINEIKNDSNEVGERIKKLEDQGKLPIFNCHTHIFNFNHVHDRFLKGMIPFWFRLLLLLIDLLIIWLIFNISNKPVAWIVLIILSPFLIISLLDISLFNLKLHSLLKNNRFRTIVKLLKRLLPGRHDFFERYADFILHSYDTVFGKIKSQKDIFNNLQSYYPDNTKFITLSMDLDYMIHCRKPLKKSRYYSQLEDLKCIKSDPLFNNKIYPFIHADPRRIADSGHNYLEELTQAIECGSFQGIKIYPALGYFPFDRRLKPIYDLAIEYNLPIITHCSIGPVYYRGNIKTLENDGYFEKGKYIHPFTRNELKGENPKAFTPHFTHPLNYYCLMNEPEKLFNYWQKCDEQNREPPNNKQIDNYNINDLKKYKNLKLCFGHYGGSEEWLNYLQDPWLPKEGNSLVINNNLIHESHGKWKYQDKEIELKDIKPYSWYNIISDMVLLRDEKNELTFPNLYADISYNLSNEKILPLLKVRLETNHILAEKTLFGTDFYMVSTNASEREITMKLRSFIGEENFRQIAVLNPLNFLSSKKTKMITLLG